AGASDAQSSPDTLDAGIKLDAEHGANDAGDPQPVWINVPEPDRWKRARPCTEPELSFEPVTDEPFEVPDTPDFKSALTKQDFIDIWGSPLPISYGVFVDSEFGAGPGMQTDVFANPGDNITFRIHLSQPKWDEHFLITPMLDYQPVEATFQRYTSDRQELVETVTDTGYDFETIDRFDVVDMTIPEEAFAPGQTQEVAIAVRSADFPFALNFYYRFSVHYGGFDPPKTRPCFAAPLGELWNTAQFEQSENDEFDETITVSHAGGATVGIFTNPTPKDYNVTPPGIGHPRPVSPGETVEIFSTIFRQSREVGPSPLFLQPTIDGRPVGEGWWRGLNGPAPRAAFRYVDA
ncbi:MAG TPA: hypothetical protein VLA12_16280, partial [Planctomycetaceae bacterium]|nr:hypothetical protein [Planctomycetaceae bacterium]